MIKIKIHWNLREAIYDSFHRWPSMVAFIVVGSLLGWLLAFVWPAYYRATTQVYVGLNPYRTYSDTNFLALTAPKYSNIDNYHYWQMSQLESVIFLNEFIQETLEALRQSDPYWNDVSQGQLRDMLGADWRSAGTWSLTAEHRDPQRASQAAGAWSAVVTRRVEEAVAAARETIVIDQQLEALAKKKSEASLRQQALASTRKQLQDWAEAARDLPENEPLALSDRWRVLALVTGLAKFTPAWMALLQDEPAATSGPDAYLEWVGQILQSIDAETTALGKDVNFIEQEYVDLARQYADTASQSLGLSPNLEVKDIQSLAPKILRPAGSFILIGGIIGFLSWVITQLVIITKKVQGQ